MFLFTLTSENYFPKIFDVKMLHVAPLKNHDQVNYKQAMIFFKFLERDYLTLKSKYTECLYKIQDTKLPLLLRKDCYSGKLFPCISLQFLFIYIQECICSWVFCLFFLFCTAHACYFKKLLCHFPISSFIYVYVFVWFFHYLLSHPVDLCLDSCPSFKKTMFCCL